MPTLKNTSLGMPRNNTAATAPSRPNGTTSITASGIDQLSYSAASTRNTTSIDSSKSHGACAPDSRSCSDWLVHCRAKPDGSFSANRSISAIAWPVETPDAGAPDRFSAGKPR